MFGFGAKIPEVSPTDLQEELSHHRALYVLDVRTPGEFRQGHIPQAHLIPLGELGKRMLEIPNDKTIVTVCRSGSRSKMAATQLQKSGYQVKNLKGGMMQWKGPVK